MWPIILAVYLGIINIITFIVYAVDKNAAKKQKWRVRESTLLLLAFIGGSVGALLGMYGLRHKTKHLQFVIPVPIFFVLHVILVVFLVLKVF